MREKLREAFPAAEAAADDSRARQRTPKAIRLCNNALQSLTGIAECLSEFLDISAVNWIDLSCNEVEAASEVRRGDALCCSTWRHGC